jgi:hypothetical protein
MTTRACPAPGALAHQLGQRLFHVSTYGDAMHRDSRRFSQLAEESA